MIVNKFEMRSEDPPFDFSLSFGEVISIKIEIDPPNFFRRLKDAFLTIMGYKTECCINLVGKDADRLRSLVTDCWGSNPAACNKAAVVTREL